MRVSTLLVGIAISACLCAHGAEKRAVNKPEAPVAGADGLTSPVSAVPAKDVPLTLDNKSKSEGKDTQERKNGWPDVLLDPTAVFTALIAIFTLGLYWDGRVTNRRSLRAYVGVTAAGICEGSMLQPPVNDKLNIPGAVLQISNTGQTPAYRVVSWADMAVIEPINEHTLVVPKLEEKNTATIGRDRSFPKSQWFKRALTENEIQDIRSHARAIYVYGRIEYIDVFNRKRFTDFRLHYSGLFPPPENAVLSHSEKGNRAK